MSRSLPIHGIAIFAVLACAFTASLLPSLAIGQTQPVMMSPSPTPAEASLAPIPEGNATAENPLGTEPLIPTYQCMAEENAVCRACMVGPSGQHWFRADYLLWWTRGVRPIPLVTTSNVDDGGVIGRDSTEILFGDDWVNAGSQSGMRINFGWWLHCGRTAGIEFDFMTLGENGTDFSFSSDSEGNPLYARPFYDVNPEVMDNNAELVSDSRWLRGTVDGRIDQYFHSAGVNLRLNLCCHEPCCSCCCEEPTCEEGCGGSCESEITATRAAAYCRGVGSFLGRFRPQRYRVDLIAGYRNYQLNDSLRVNEDLLAFEGHGWIAEDTTMELYDEFRTRNEFHGAELGILAQAYRGRWSLELLAKAAFGNNHQVVNIAGQSTFQSPGDDPYTVDGGLLALDTNIGRYSRNRFVVIPQFGAELGYQLTCRLRAYAGYNLILWSSVARASEQVDSTVNSTYVPQEGEEPTGAERPQFAWRDSNFWAQGMNFGLEYRF